MKQSKIAEIYKECSAIILEQTQEIHELILGTGNYDADVLFIGECPTAEEESLGLPFAGRSGKLLNEALEALGLRREDVYTTHLVKYRPYRINEKSDRVVSRPPKKEEIQFFLPYLLEEINIIAPKIIVTLGSIPLKTLMDDNRLQMSAEHGKVRTRYIDGRAYKILPFTQDSFRNEDGEENEDLEVLRKLVNYISKYKTDGTGVIDSETKDKTNASNGTDLGSKSEFEAKLSGQQAIKNEKAKIEEASAVRNMLLGDPVAEKEENTKKKAITPGQLLREKLQSKDILYSKNSSSQVEQSKQTTQEPVQETEEDHEILEYIEKKNLTDKFGKIDRLSQQDQNMKQVNQEKQQVIPPKKALMKTYTTEQKSGKLKAIIIYGGDGYADDPTLVAIDRISNVLTDLSTNIIRLDLYKKDYDIQEFFSELEEAHAVVIATTVEWIGIGGHLQLFLDKCWKYGNKKYFEDVYLFGVVISKQHFERDAFNHLIKSWELLGGVEGSSLCTNIKKSVELETNSTLLNAIDKKTEEFYRIAHQNRAKLPTSIRNNKVFIEVPSIEEESNPIGGTYREETTKPTLEKQDTFIPNYEAYMEKQQQDIADIASLFKQKISSKEFSSIKTEPEFFKAHFIGGEDINCKLQWNINDRANKNFVLELRSGKIQSYYGNVTDYNTILNLEDAILEKILEGKMTIQRAFMTGEIKAKGDFTVLYKLDSVFNLSKV